MIKTWINSFIDPKKTFKDEKPNSTIVKGVLNYLIGSLLVFSIPLLFGLIVFFLIYKGSIEELEFSYLFLFVSITIGLIGPFIYGAILFFLAKKLFGGTGSFTQQYYLTSLPIVPIFVLTAIITIWIPFEGLPVILIGLISLYFTTLAVREAHNFSTGKALLSLIITGIVSAIIYVIVMAMIVTMLFPVLFPPTPHYVSQVSLVIGNPTIVEKGKEFPVMFTIINREGKDITYSYEITAENEIKKKGKILVENWNVEKVEEMISFNESHEEKQKISIKVINPEKTEPYYLHYWIEVK